MSVFYDEVHFSDLLPFKNEVSNIRKEDYKSVAMRAKGKDN